MEQNQYLQNCGDILEIIEPLYKKGRNLYYRCKFLKYPCEVISRLQLIKNGSVANPQIEQVEFIDKLWPQNCGDTLKIIKKSDKKDSNNISLFECEFIKYPCKVLARKYHIIKGGVNNSILEDKDFIGQNFEQNCGDILKVLEKTKQKDINNHHYLYRCQFQKYPYEVLAKKSNIINGNVDNPQIEVVEFQNKIWPQNCGDSLKVIKAQGNKDQKGVWLCEFIKYPCKVICSKTGVIKGSIDNPTLPIYSKNNFVNYLNKYIKTNNSKPTIEELCNEFNRSRSTILHKISEFEIYDYINYNWSITSIPEEEVRDYCRSINNSFLDKSIWNILKDREIDIYSPKLKLGFEFNGDYWHSDEVILKRYGITSKERDLEKYNLAKEKGINLYFIWEHDWKNRQEVVKRYIKIIINKSINKN